MEGRTAWIARPGGTKLVGQEGVPVALQRPHGVGDLSADLGLTGPAIIDVNTACSRFTQALSMASHCSATRCASRALPHPLPKKDRRSSGGAAAGASTRLACDVGVMPRDLLAQLREAAPGLGRMDDCEVGGEGKQEPDVLDV